MKNDMPSEEEIDTQHQLIGKFFVQYEETISIIPFLIPKIIFSDNNFGKNKRNIEILLEGLTSSSLRTKFDALIADNYRSQELLIKLNCKLSNINASITEIRNSFAHGSYRLGWSDFDGNLNKNTFSLRHSKSTKKGFQKRSRIYQIDELENLLRQMSYLKKAYQQIGVIIGLLNEDIEIQQKLINLEDHINNIGQINFQHIDELN
ncbi:hypothetical protein LVD15_26200 [Fulvivirga maritima]|uniref:hypothetical protein n=1 Tax=Fulvivirga maritima TaxID=2904247 RepID=UPI001F3C2589|nr:hypothetical protein [Fulvivirga maritima]UII26746.1 hypothetical protein LVD15_26200 [Fulvivirga maritima]